LTILAFTVEYDGSRFHGFQYQTRFPTVQGELERVFGSLLPHGFKLRVAGRTDRGVHALGQVITVSTEQSFRWSRFLKLANERLSPHIRLKEQKEVSCEFHPRHSAILRHYRYCLSEDLSLVGPMLSSYLTFVDPPLDWNRVKEAQHRLLGTNNFVSFCTNPVAEPKLIRSLDRIESRSQGTFHFLEFYGRSFLRGMVRNMTGWLIAIGQGRFAPEVIDRLLAKEKKDQSVKPAPPQGLYLMQVWYPDDRLPEWYRRPSTVQEASCVDETDE